jgi:hypothetical protein
VDEFDDIVIGSGLAALGVVMGLPAQRRVLVLTGETPGSFSHYDAQGAVPCAFSGMGGLGGFWHGVIPVSRRHDFVEDASSTIFSKLFTYFYPHAAIDTWAGKPALFVPWKPIRPAEQLTRLATQRPDRLTCTSGLAHRIDMSDGHAQVHSTAGVFRAQRAWVAAGAVHTPQLLARSFGNALQRPYIGDHVLCYVGHVDNVSAPQPQRTRDGVYFPAFYDDAQTALYTLRPARFSFRQLDHGIEQRAAFGLPTGNAVAKIMRSMSPGLLTEAFYNRFGLLAKAPRYSIYAQAPLDQAYVLGEGTTPLKPQLDRIRQAGDAARARQPFAAATLSRRPDLYIPGIHLHHSVDLDALRAAGLQHIDSPVQVVDASTLSSIGTEHHSFKMLCAAYQRAQMLTV